MPRFKTFQKEVLSPSSGSKRKKPLRLLLSTHLRGLLSGPEDGVCTLLRDVSKLLLDYLTTNPGMLLYASNVV
jgi:hypothetical protein